MYKTFFLIANLMIAIIAFSYIVGDVYAGPTCGIDPATGQSTCGGGLFPTMPSLNDPSNWAQTPSSSNMPSTGSGGVSGQSNPTIDPNDIFGSKTGQIDASTAYGNKASYLDSLGQGQNVLTGSGSSTAGGRISGPSSGGLSSGIGGTGDGTVGSGGIPSYPNGQVKTVIPGGQFNSGPVGAGGAISNYFDNFLGNLAQVGMGAGIGATIGALAGGKDGALWGSIAGAAGVFAFQMAKAFGLNSIMSGIIGIGVFLAIFLLTYKKEHTELVEFNCLPWQAPIGGADCEKCNDYAECGEYTCKSLGQACALVNIGTKDQKCVWKNPYDTNSPIIEMKNVSQGLKFKPDTSIRPPATGVQITNPAGKGQCVKAFFPLVFRFDTDEPAQCKIDYNLTSDPKLAFDMMNFYVGGVATFSYNHTESLSLPGPDAVNKINPELHNDGTYTLYIRCQDANGNFNVNPFSVRFCVEKGPDETPPMIVNESIPSGMPIQFNRSDLNLEVYTNEPADCKWSKEDRDYELMEGNMTCNNEIWQMNNDETYTCRTTLNGIESRTDNVFYFRCKDQPWNDDSERNKNKLSYSYIVKGTQPLNMMDIGPNGTIYGATDSIPVYLFVQTDNGNSNGEARCYYSTSGTESTYIEFSNTSDVNTAVNYHTQRQDLVTGDYTYYVKCVDKGGNAVYNQTSFRVETDKFAPLIIRAYKESGELKIATSENSECSYSFTNCNFEVDDGIKMTTLDYISHNTEWKVNKYYYIRCKDKYNNQPNPNTCTMIIRPFEFGLKSSVEGTIQL